MKHNLIFETICHPEVLEGRIRLTDTSRLTCFESLSMTIISLLLEPNFHPAAPNET